MTSEQVDELWQRLGDQLDMLVTRTQKKIRLIILPNQIESS